MEPECPRTPDIVESEDGYCSSFVSSDFIAENDIEACFSSEPNEPTPNSSPSFSHQDDLMLNAVSPNHSFHNLELFNVSPRPAAPPTPEADLEELWNISPSDLQPLSPYSQYSDLEGLLNLYSHSPGDMAQGARPDDREWRESPSYSPNIHLKENKEKDADKDSTDKSTDNESDQDSDKDDESDVSSSCTQFSGYSTDHTIPYNSDTSEAQEQGAEDA